MLRTLSKNSPATATGAHISITAHITHEELAGGSIRPRSPTVSPTVSFGLCASRSKLFPWGGSVRITGVDRLARSQSAAEERARRRIPFDDARSGDGNELIAL